MAPTLESAKAAEAGQRGWFNRLKSAATKAGKTAIECPSAFAGEQVNTCFNNFNSQTEKIMEKLKVAMNLDTPRESICLGWQRIRNTGGVQHNPSPLYQSHGNGCPSTYSGLQSTPCFGTCVFSHTGARGQGFGAFSGQYPGRIAFMAAQDAVIFQDQQLIVVYNVGMTIEIFGVGGMLDDMLIKAEFRQRYQMQARRVEYFTTNWKSGDSYSKHLAKMESLAKEADLANMSIDQIQAFCLISSVYADEKLKKKLLELENPSLRTVMQNIL
ncbi:hypothetical protein TCAL_14567 [Tigriopus californicus]|uniref:Uncharacterized protein n=1 Tax=Tigriopus californicus TaxID=6832 RepID=A0A553PAW8_TIGCA|nr:hypothetical protein TCAL_14567 [Tigriopus californicus]